MRKEGRGPSLGLYFVLLLLMLGAYYIFFSTGRTQEVSYSQVEDLFRLEQVESFYVKDGNQLYLKLKGGLTVRNQLGDTYLFRTELGELIEAHAPQDASERGDSGIIAGCAKCVALAVEIHAPEFYAVKFSAVVACAFLAEEYRSL